MTGAVLAPLAARYASWLDASVDEVVRESEQRSTQVRALQLILRLERDPVPSWHRALSLAAAAAAAVCLDPRSEPGGEWHEPVAAYCAGMIRKVTRRARGAQWAAVQELPGVGLTDGTTQVRALLPGPVDELDKRVSKLQVGGTDVPVDDEPTAWPEDALRLWVPPEPVMTLGKTMAQTGHAGMIAAALLAADDPAVLQAWLSAGLPVVARRAPAPEWARLAEAVSRPERAWRSGRLLAVRDAGFTEIAPGTVTVIAAAPSERRARRDNGSERGPSVGPRGRQ